MSFRLGMLGGMFDPVHQGHVALARRARDELALQQLHMIPCHVPAHRAQAHASGEHRLAMLRLAMSDEPGVVIDDRELRRSQVSYTVDTLQSLQEDFPEATLVCIMGWDSFSNLTSWHQWERILELSHLCVATRPASSDVSLAAEIAALEPLLSTLLAERRITSPGATPLGGSGGIYLLDDLALPYSSTAVRSAWLDGDSNVAGLPGPVLQYIREHQLYS